VKVGDTVTRTNHADSLKWKVTNIKSDSRAFWIQLDMNHSQPDVWYDASYFEVINGIS
jgi:hypothetical protein